MSRPATFTRTAALLAFAAATMFISACSDAPPAGPASSGPLQKDGYDNGSNKIAVLSDIHYYDRSLGVGGAAWNAYMFSDPKLLEMTKELVDAIVADMRAQNVEYVLIPGDITKDGEQLNHNDVVQILNGLEDAGIEVFVVPGNHDVNNADACGFSGTQTTPQPTVTPAAFASLYGRFGYTQALARDPNSLSYTADIGRRFRLVCIDDCIYPAGAPAAPTTGGNISTATDTWIKAQIAAGKQDGRIVIGMMHHALIEHFTGQSVFPITNDYVTANWQTHASAYAALGMRAVFTGHFHANDITRFDGDGGWLYDIATGSPASAPCAYRIVKSEGDKIFITTRPVTSLPYNNLGSTFPAYATGFLYNGLTNYVTALLVAQFGLSPQAAGQVAPAVAAAYVANYAGDEVMPQQVLGLIQYLGTQPYPAPLLAQFIGSMFTDLPPADNTLTIDLVTGKTK